MMRAMQIIEALDGDEDIDLKSFAQKAPIGPGDRVKITDTDSRYDGLIGTVEGPSEIFKGEFLVKVVTPVGNKYSIVLPKDAMISV